MRLLTFALLLTVSLSGYAEETAPEDPTAFNEKLRQVEMQYAEVNGIKLAYKVIGQDDAPTILMVMGLGGSHLLWGDGMPFMLAEAGYRTVVYDNRDVGESQRFTEAGDPVLWWEMLKDRFGFEVNSAYDLSDMAADGIGLLDHLNVDSAHVVGASMGGMIAQVIAARYPDRVDTLVSIMSSPDMLSGNLPMPDEQDNALIGDASSGDMEADAAAQLEAIGLHTDAFPRQIAAILKSGDRSEEVATITAPTLVLHGVDDTLVKPEHGKRTAELIEGSTHITYEGMAHDLPEEVLPTLVADMLAHFNQRQVPEAATAAE